jgi:hypothetical protein
MKGRPIVNKSEWARKIYFKINTKILLRHLIGIVKSAIKKE